MRYNLAIPVELKSARNRVSYLARTKREVDIKQVVHRRTLPQNNYLHLLLSAFGMHFGYTLEEAKQVYKEVNQSIYKYHKKERVFWRSSADLNKEEMSHTIEYFKQKSAEAGCPLPPATNQEWLRSIANDVERYKYY